MDCSRARLSRNLWFQLCNGAIHVDDIKLKTALQTISDLLLKEDRSKLLAHPNQLQLARALAYLSPKSQQSLHHYAALPKQENEDEEAARISAIQNLSDQRDEAPLRDIWHQVVAESIAERRLSDADGGVHQSLFSKSLDPLAGHATFMKPLVKGIGGGRSTQRASPRSIKPGRRPAHHLIDVVRGIRGRRQAEWKMKRFA